MIGSAGVAVEVKPTRVRPHGPVSSDSPGTDVVLRPREKQELEEQRRGSHRQRGAGAKERGLGLLIKSKRRVLALHYGDTVVWGTQWQIWVSGGFTIPAARSIYAEVANLVFPS